MEYRFTVVVRTTETSQTVVHSDNIRQVKSAAKNATLYSVIFCRVYDKEAPGDELVFFSDHGDIIVDRLFTKV